MITKIGVVALAATACLGVMPSAHAQSGDPWVVGCVDTSGGWVCAFCDAAVLHFNLRPELRTVAMFAVAHC